MDDIVRIDLPEMIPDFPFETYQELLFDGGIAVQQR